MRSRLRLPTMKFRRWTLTIGICCLFGTGLFLIWTFELPVPHDVSDLRHAEKHDLLAKDQMIILKKKVSPVNPTPNLSASNTFLKENIVVSPGPVVDSKCPDLTPPTVLGVEKFQPYNHKLTSAYFFSAYHETRNGRNELRIIALVERGVAQSMWCQLWYFEGKETRLVTVSGAVMALPEGSGRRYDGCWLTCKVPSGTKSPDAVSVAPSECAQTSNGLPVVPLIKQPPKQVSFALCVSPFNLNYDKVDEFLEILTLNRIFGANHVYFYNYSTSPRIRRLTEAMFDEGFVTVVQWHLPMKVHVWPVPPGYVEEIKYFGQMAMLQDCLMRGMGRYKFLVYTDMDELAVPRRHKTWKELYQASGYLDKPAAVVTFRNTFFKLEWPSDSSSMADPQIAASKARSLIKTRRERTIFNPGARSKYIVDPLQIRTCGVHNIWEAERPSGAMAILSPDEGLIHHYRNWEGMGEKTFVVDRNMLRFRDEILEKYSQARKKYLKLLR